MNEIEQKISISEIGKKLAQSRMVGLIHYKSEGWGQRLCEVVGHAFMDDPISFGHFWEMMGGTNIIDYKGCMLIQLDETSLVDDLAINCAQWWAKYWEEIGWECGSTVYVYFNNHVVWNGFDGCKTINGMYEATRDGIRKVPDDWFDKLSIRWKWEDFDWLA